MIQFKNPSKRQEGIELIMTYIVNNKLTVGDKLPSERELSMNLNLSRTCVRQSLDYLVSIDYLYKKSSSGTYIKDKKYHRNLRGVNNMMDYLRNSDKKIDTKILSTKTIYGNAENMKCLNIDNYIPCYEINRIRYIEYEKAFMETIVINGKVCPDILKHYNDKSSLFSIFKNIYNCDIKGGEEVIELNYANKQNSKLLDIKEGSPLFYVYGNTFNSNNEYIEYYKILFKFNLFKMVIN